MYRVKPLLFSVVLAAVLAVAFVGPSSLVAASAPHVFLAHCGSWHGVNSPNNGPAGSALLAVAAASAQDVWAVGDYLNTQAKAQQTLIEHWNGTTWQIVSSPNPGTYLNDLRGVVAVSATDVWTVGYYQNSFQSPFQTLTEHWNGTSWSVVQSANIGDSDNLLGVTAASSGDVWAVGVYYPTASSPAQTLIEHWNGTSWSVVTSPNVGTSSNQLLNVTAVSSSNVWAVGHYMHQSFDQTLIEHWNGTSWSVVNSPNGRYTDDILYGVAATSASDLWAVGTFLGGALTEHWNGQKWSVIATPNIQAGFVTLFGVAAVSANNVWAVGDFGDYPPSNFHTLIEHWNGARWQIVSSVNRSSIDGLSGVAAISAHDVWAVGDYKYVGHHPDSTLIEHFC